MIDEKGERHFDPVLAYVFIAFNDEYSRISSFFFSPNWVFGGTLTGEPVMVIACASTPKTNAASLQRLYTGCSVSIGQLSMVPVNLPLGHPVRQSFLGSLLGQDGEQYTAYWLVRRNVGKVAPPKELADGDEILDYFRNTPGAVGYLPQFSVPKDINVISRR